jgi:hypothetical protein
MGLLEIFLVFFLFTTQVAGVTPTASEPTNLWYESVLSQRPNELFSLTNAEFFTTELSVSFLLACFVTVSIFGALLLSRPGTLVASSFGYLGLLMVVSLVFIFCPTLFSMFVAFECLLLISLGLLKLTSKSERIGEAISEMFM